MYSKILVPIDISYEGDYWLSAPLKKACELVSKSGGIIYAITIVPENLLKGFYPDVYSEDVAENAKRKLEAILRKHCPSEAPIEARVEEGGICSEVLRVARELPADLIVMASHGPLARDYLLGSNAAHVTLHAPCSVFVVREAQVANEEFTLPRQR